MIQIIFHAVAQLAAPGTVIGYDVTSGSQHDVTVDSLPSLTQQVEQNFGEFTCGDMEFSARNDDGWWDATGFLSTMLSPFNRYPLCHWIDVFRDGALAWQGDVDYKTIVFDRKARAVKFSALGPLNRLAQYSAESVRRNIPDFFDAGTTSEVGAGYMRDYTKTWYPTDITNCVLIDSNGTAYPITGTYGMGTGLGRNGISVATGYGAPYYLSFATNTPAAGPYRIIPLAVQTRVAHNLGAVTTGNGWLKDTRLDLTTGTITLFPVNGFSGMSLFDSNGVAFPITGNTADTINVGNSGTAAGSTPSGPLYSVRRSNYPNLLETLPDFATIGIAAGDILTFVSTGAAIGASVNAGFRGQYIANTEQYVIQSVGPNANPPLTANQAWLTESIKYDIELPTDGVSLSTPYYRNQAVSTLVSSLFQAALIGSYAVNVQAFVNQLVPYADFGGKSVADALAELALISNCTLSCGFSGGPSAPLVTFYFQRRDVGLGSIHNLSLTDGVGNPMLGSREDSPQWEMFYTMVTVTGANGVVASSGSLRYGGSSLDVQSDFMNRYDWIAQVRDRLFAFFSQRRPTSKITLRSEYATGIGLLSRVSLSGTDEWIVFTITDSMRQPSDFVDLTVINAVGVQFTPPDMATTNAPLDLGYIDEAPPPAPPIVTGVAYVGFGGPGERRDVSISWPYTLGELLGLQCTVWSGSAARPSTPSVLVGWSGILSWLLRPDSSVPPVLHHWIFDQLLSGLDFPLLVDYQAVLKDGRMSTPSDPVTITQ